MPAAAPARQVELIVCAGVNQRRVGQEIPYAKRSAASGLTSAEEAYDSRQIFVASNLCRFDRPGWVFMSPSAHRSEKRVFHTLNGIRGVAALTVVMWHEKLFFGMQLRPANGYIAVDIFFILSGFVLAHSYADRFDRGLTALGFMKLRLIRLYPLYALGSLITIFGIVVGMFISKVNWTPWHLLIAVITSALFLPAPPLRSTADGLYPLNVPAWSLGLELFINLFFGIFWRVLTPRVASAVIIVSALAVCGIDITHGSLDVGSKWDDWIGGFPRVFFGFTMGVLIYHLYRAKLAVPQISSFVILFFVILVLFFDPGKWRTIYDLFCVLIAAPILVLLGVATSPGRLTTVAYRFLGDTSYAVYALHIPTYAISLGILSKLLGDRLAHFVPWIGFVIAAGYLCFCWAIDRFYDAPVRAWLSRRMAPRASTKPVAVRQEP